MDIQGKIAEHEAALDALESQQAKNQAAMQQTAIAIHERRGAIIALRALLADEPVPAPDA
jgi:hypothetical protein